MLEEILQLDSRLLAASKAAEARCAAAFARMDEVCAYNEAKVMKAFADSGYTGNLNYEAARFVSKLPADLLPQGGQLMADVCRHLVNRYEYYKSQN